MWPQTSQGLDVSVPWRRDQQVAAHGPHPAPHLLLYIELGFEHSHSSAHVSSVAASAMEQQS